MSDVREASNVVTSENLAEFHAQKLGLAADAPTEAVDAEPVVEQAQSEPEPEVGEETQAEAEDKPKKQNPKLEKRFSELSKARDAAKQEAANERQQREALEARLRALEQQPQQQQTVSHDEPMPENYSDAFEYAKDLAKFEARRMIEAEKQQVEQAKAAERQNEVIKTWTERVQKAKAEMPDYDQMVASSDVAIHDVLRDAIIESDVGPKILYHLAENEEYAKKVAGMPLPQALKELGKLEARYSDSPEEKSPAVRTSKAPPPINPIRGATNMADVPISSNGEFTGTPAQWRALRQAGKIR
jgi:hypothetical protein